MASRLLAVMYTYSFGKLGDLWTLVCHIIRCASYSALPAFQVLNMMQVS